MRIHAIQTGRVQIKMSQIDGRGHGLRRQLAPLTDPVWSPWLPTYAWAIEHPEGVILVDTGSSTKLKELPRWHPYFRYAVRFDIDGEQEVGPQLRALGIGPRDVTRIVMTHLHIDHDAGLGFFPYSQVLASRMRCGAPPASPDGCGAICRSAGPHRSIRRRWCSRTSPTDRSPAAAG